MTIFRVWIVPHGSNARIGVESSENARWLLARLSTSFVFKSSEPIREERESPGCSFEVPYSSQTSHAALERLLASIPEVTLLAKPV